MLNLKPLAVLAFAALIPLQVAHAAGTTDVHGVTLGMDIGTVEQAFGGACRRLNAGSVGCSDADDPDVNMYAFDVAGRVQSVILDFCSDQPFESVLKTVRERYGVEFRDMSAQDVARTPADQKLPHWDAGTADATLALTPSGNCHDGRAAYRLAMDPRIKAAPPGTPKF